MNVEALDHVNIITDRLDDTAEFYGKLLGLVRKDAPPPLTPPPSPPISAPASTPRPPRSRRR